MSLAPAATPEIRQETQFATGVARALARGEEGHGISRDDALLLLEHAPTHALLAAAANLRDRVKGRIVSYSKKIFIPLTHLCRDYCGYCTFRADPKEGHPAYMSPDEVLAAAEAGRRAGCKEALFSLGDQPERIFPEARAFLNRLGFATTLDYLVAMTKLVVEKTGLLPHSNPGLMDADNLARLRETNISLGLMLESVSPRLRHKGAAHWRAPDKAPALRLRTIEEAGRQSIAFTTGILIGIGETAEERVDSLFAIRRLHENYSHIQEVLIQPFRAKADTRMAGACEPDLDELQRTLAIARLILGDMNVQSPPNLVAEDFPQLLAAGINDWGGISPVTKDFINPEAAWPQIAILDARSAEAGFRLRERLAIYPEFARDGRFVDPRLTAQLDHHRGPDFYAKEEP
ncbi:MAG TPA: 7,8-didemethyl-8-hydroxy-5-deazariboflavin synthase CofG [Micropepsaceae bacterium]|nr:7,8-didemethyl-8-hydroxy-5-deazariboflavin synthase CofG [Micropepsaceae bacterium]